MQFLPSFDFGIPYLIFLLMGFSVVVCVVYVLWFYARLAFVRAKYEVEEKFPPLTIILAARNESDNLYENIPLLMQQDYPEFELIIVNHQSTDDSSYLLTAYKRQYPNLRVIEVARSPHLKPGKKLPITLGVKGARFEHLILTDADCRPASNQWLKGMVSGFKNGSEMVIGYGPFNREKGFVNRLVRFDSAWIGMNYLSFALANMPYMGVGRNLAYTKSLFNRVNGFKSHYSISSGDDDLFVQEACKETRVSVVVSPDTYCFSDGQTTWDGWVRQKSRHFTTSAHYEVIKKLLLGIYPFFSLLAWLSFVILMFDSEYRWLTLSVFLVLFSLKWWVQGRSFRNIGERSFVPFLPFWEFLHLLAIPVLFYTADKKRTSKW